MISLLESVALVSADRGRSLDFRLVAPHSAATVVSPDLWVEWSIQGNLSLTCAGSLRDAIALL